jgi:hypothetical protein
LTLDILKRYAEQNGLQWGNVKDILPGYKYGGYFDPTDDCHLDSFLDKALFKSTQNMSIAVKVHCNLTDYAKSLIEKKTILASASFRHPADCILSFMDAYKKETHEQKDSRFRQGESFDSSLNTFKHQGNVFLEWAAVKNIVLVYFNEVAIRPEAVIQKLCRQIGVEINAGELLHPYLEGKREIWEYNKGVVDRRFLELSSSQILEVERQCENLVCFIKQYNKYSLSRVNQ